MPLKAVTDDDLSDAEPAQGKPAASPKPKPLTTSPKTKSGKESPKDSKETSPKTKADKESPKGSKEADVEAGEKSSLELKGVKKVTKSDTKKTADTKKSGNKANLPVPKAKQGTMKKPASAKAVMKRPAAGSDGPVKQVNVYTGWYKRDLTTGISIKYSDGSQHEILRVRPRVVFF